MFNTLDLGILQHYAGIYDGRQNSVLSKLF